VSDAGLKYRSDDNRMLGAAYMSAGMFMGASIDVSVKALAGDYGTSQIVLLRTLLALPPILIICHYQGGLAKLMTPRWGWQIYRGLLTAGANFGFFYALAHIPLITAVLLAYISPVLIVLLARPLLGERVGLNRWFGVIVAFAGVLIVLQPTSFDIGPAAWSVFGSATCWALLSLSNRRLAGLEHPAVLTFYTLPISGVLAGILTVGDWRTPDIAAWGLFAVAGLSAGAAHLFAAHAYRNAPASVIAPFEYTALFWTALSGYVFWNEQPGLWVWIGGVAVILGGYLALRSRA
jgi:drug/metabolite transporter (DMT)-like permease